MLQKLMAEAFGTAILVRFGCGAAVIAGADSAGITALPGAST